MFQQCRVEQTPDCYSVGVRAVAYMLVESLFWKKVSTDVTEKEVSPKIVYTRFLLQRLQLRNCLHHFLGGVSGWYHSNGLVQP